METIQATVNPRLLTKASRLFTGTLQGRVIELLQNARRAGATKVEITNQDGLVTVRDNGRGIDDFARLLDLGGSGWDQAREASEDPAGVGVFCLAPREVLIRSNGKMATISGEMWTGQPVPVTDDPEPIEGTLLRFKDELWTHTDVDVNAVFCGMDVTLDGEACPRAPFISDDAAYYPELGYRIWVRQTDDLDQWHTASKRGKYYYANVLVNFHGQVVTFDHRPVDEHGLNFLVDLTGEPTAIRLMLPARTRLVENDAFEQLKRALELEAYRYLQKRGHHRLPFAQYQRAKELGIDLPEAVPTYHVGLLTGETPEPIEVTMPKDLLLAKCYQLEPENKDLGEVDEANIHLLAALGKFDEPFVPVVIQPCYDGYSWARLPTINTARITAGKALHEDWMASGKLVCMDSLGISVETSDGRTWRSPVCMAIRSIESDKRRFWVDEEVLVTPAAKELDYCDIWYHLGGWYEDGDTFDTQLAVFSEELDRFWTALIGPDENLRRSILGLLESLPDWKHVKAEASGTVRLTFNDGSEKTIEPPPVPSAS